MADTTLVTALPVQPAPVVDDSQFVEDVQPPVLEFPRDLVSSESTTENTTKAIYPATLEEADLFCLSGTTVDFPQQIFATDAKDASKTVSIINCSQLFALKKQSGTKPSTSP